MPPLRIPIDGLWRCLCPSIEDITLAQSSTRVLSSQIRARRPKYNGRRVAQPRSFHSSPPNLNKIQFNKDNDELDIRLKENRVRRVNVFTANQYDHIPLSQLYDQLQRLRSTEGSYRTILDIVEHLITVRGEIPSTFHYELLIYANTDAEHGSVEAVKDLLQEMKEERIGLTSTVYHCVLQVLAIHPDYLLRNEMLEEMKERWFGLSAEGWHNLVAGLLRDRQYEMAMDKLDQMHTDEIPVQSWLYDVFLYKLCHAGELDEALQLLIYRFQRVRKHIASPVWYYMLDKFSRAFHYEGTKYIWNLRVSSSYLNPSDGICANVLNLAARYADPILATAAVKRLSSRRTTLTSFHFEALLAAYTGAHDLTTAFRILNIMAKAKIDPQSASTRPIYTYLSESPTRPKEAWDVIVAMFKQGQPIHIAAANVIIEGAIAHNNFKEAMGYYKELHKYCAKGPTIETFNILFQGAGRTHHVKSTAMFLVSEMAAAGIKADYLTYDRMIMICLKDDDDYEDAFRYLDEMIEVGRDKYENGQKGWWMRRGTAGLMVEKCAEKGDERAKLILDQISTRLYKGQKASKKWLDEMYNLIEQKFGKEEGDVDGQSEVESDIIEQKLGEEEEEYVDEQSKVESEGAQMVMNDK